MTNADNQTVIVSDSVCDFARSRAPECFDKVVNETNFEYFGYTIDYTFLLLRIKSQLIVRPSQISANYMLLWIRKQLFVRPTQVSAN